MPRVIDAQDSDTIGLDDLVDILEEGRFDPRDEDSFASFGPALKRLGNNRTFLADIILDELKSRCAGQVAGNQYTPQVIMLHNPGGRYALRANIWPAEKDDVVRRSGADPFFYHRAHDHSFSFLTVGYLGPGYWSDYYEYDYDTVAGYAGEEVALRFVEKAKLDEGKVMLYRAHQDVHLQLPADEMSVSLNILESSRRLDFLDQYEFDVEGGTIKEIMNHNAIEPLLALSASFGGDEGIDLLDTYAARHPSDNIRFQALRARASALTTPDERIALYEKAAAGGNLYLSRMARREAARIEGAKGWLAGEGIGAT